MTRWTEYFSSPFMCLVYLLTCHPLCICLCNFCISNLIINRRDIQVIAKTIILPFLKELNCLCFTRPAVYSEQPDHYGHKYGPDAENTRLVLQDIDREVGKLLDRIAALPDDEKVSSFCHRTP